MKIAVIVAIVLAVAVIIAFSVRPARHKYGDDYDETLSDNEFR